MCLRGKPVLSCIMACSLGQLSNTLTFTNFLKQASVALKQLVSLFAQLVAGGEKNTTRQTHTQNTTTLAAHAC